jgi:hypothetical protein
MRTHNWSASPLGDPSTWPQSLRSVVGLLLGSKFPMFVAWGEELSFLYNDAYTEILGAKHPRALGARFHDIWAEIWPDISPLIDAALAGEATWCKCSLMGGGSRCPTSRSSTGRCSGIWVKQTEALVRADAKRAWR